MRETPTAAEPPGARISDLRHERAPIPAPNGHVVFQCRREEVGGEAEGRAPVPWPRQHAVEASHMSRCRTEDPPGNRTHTPGSR